ncbi:hypothetical protein AB6M97_01120 [Streptococcus hillyeri]|uniref:Transglutaminase-like domain-containing protein n=1 Tax=Streptococcus hillyeri TaxID=2282420 RepID=A0A3L9DYP7_9STRE|nr:hypothetical protein [Streptococcus hillyeri]RLY03950.1 hypothetical protein EAF07_03980 [Streptococcus hillyeri]
MNGKVKQTTNRKIDSQKVKLGLALGVIGASLALQSYYAKAEDILSQNLTQNSSFSRFLAEMNRNQKSSNTFSKDGLGVDTAFGKIKDELSVTKRTAINVRELGGNEGLLTQVDVQELLPKLRHRIPNFDSDYTLVTVNGKYLYDDVTLYIVKKSGHIVNSMQDYSKVLHDLMKNSGKEMDVYAPFNLDESHLNLLLQANGFGLVGDQHTIAVNHLNMYHGKVKVAPVSEYFTRVKYKNSNRTLEDYLENDNKILELVRASGAMEQATEREKITQWSNFLKSKFRYDRSLLDIGGTDNYNIGSDIYSITERDTAMCVGFSVLSARALNMMGMRSYVVYGKTKDGIEHAITRVFFDNNWHFVDTTTPLNHLVQLTIDTFSEMDKNEGGYTPNGTMRVDKSFEKWVENQNPRHLLLLNTEKALFTNKRLEYYISDGEKQQLLSLQQLLKDRYDYIVSTLEKSPQKNENLLKNIKGFVDNIEQDIEQVKSYDKMIGSVADKYRMTIDRFNSTAGSIERELAIQNFSKSSEIEKDIKAISKKATEIAAMTEDKYTEAEKNAYSDHEVEQEEKVVKTEESKKRSRRSLPSESEESISHKEKQESDQDALSQELETLVSQEVTTEEKVVVEEKQKLEESTPISEKVDQGNIVSDTSEQQESSQSTDSSGTMSFDNGLTTTLDVIKEIVSTVWESLSWILE